MNYSPKRIARIIAWINSPLLLLSPWGFFSVTDTVRIMITLGIIIGIIYFILGYKQNLSRRFSALSWIASIIINVLFICCYIYLLIDGVLLKFFIAAVYPIMILTLSIIALIKARKSIPDL